MPDNVGSNVRRAIGRALTNDRSAKVSESDAKRIVKAALGEIGKAKDPEQAFEVVKADLKAAERFLGGSTSARSELRRFDTEGRNAVTTRLGQLTGEAQLPVDVRRQFTGMIKDYDLAQGNVTVSNVRGSERSGFEFSWKAADGQARTAFATRFGDGWVFSPVKVTKAQLETVARAAQKYFDEDWAPELRDNGATAAELREMRAGFVPERVYFPGESDPNDLVSSYELVFQVNNPTGSDHGVFCGLNPDGSTEVYSFN